MGYAEDKMDRQLTDSDIPWAFRTQANFWRSRYFESYKELVKANKGLRRLRRKIDRLERKINQRRDDTRLNVDPNPEPQFSTAGENAGNGESAIDEIQSKGHPHHCACRQVWGDGECECDLYKQGYDPYACL